MDPNTYLDLLAKAAALLKDRNFYYALFMSLLGFFLYRSDKKITAQEGEKKKSDSLHLVALSSLQTKIDSKNCAEEFKIWKEAILNDLDSRKESESADLQMEKKRTEELNQAYQLIKNPK